jgi:hypothetical protein
LNCWKLFPGGKELAALVRLVDAALLESQL